MNDRPCEETLCRDQPATNDRRLRVTCLSQISKVLKILHSRSSGNKSHCAMAAVCATITVLHLSDKGAPLSSSLFLSTVQTLPLYEADSAA